MKKTMYFDSVEEMNEYYENGVPSNVLAIVRTSEDKSVLFATSNNENVSGEVQGGYNTSPEDLARISYLEENKADKSELEGLASQEYVSERIIEVNSGVEVSLDNYVTKSGLSACGYLTSHQDLSDYALKNEIPSLNGYATEAWVGNQGFLTQHQNLSDYPTKAEIASAGYLTSHQSLSGYATENYVDSKIEDVVGAAPAALDTLKEIGDALNNDSDFAGTMTSALSGKANASDVYTKAQIDAAGYLTSHQSLSGYATEAWVGNQGFLTSHQSLSDYPTKAEITAAGYLTAHQDLSNYALKSELPEVPSLEGYATESYVMSQGFLTSHQSLTDYATKAEVSAAGYLTSHQSLEGYATEAYVMGKGFLTEHQDLSDYALKNEIPSEVSLEGYATQEWVSNAGYLTSHQDLSDYATKAEIEAAGYLTAHQSLDGYATEAYVIGQGFITEHQSLSDYVTKDDLSNAGYITSHQSLAGLATEAYVMSKIEDVVGAAPAALDTLKEIGDSLNNDSDFAGTMTTALSGKANASDVYTKQEIDAAGYLTSHQSLTDYVTKSALSECGYLTSHQSLSDYALKSELPVVPSLEGYATEAYVMGKGFITEHQSLDGYATEAYVMGKGFLTEHQSLSDYVTKAEVSAAGYLTSHQSLADYVTKTELNNAAYLTSHQSLAGYATEAYVTNAISAIDLYTPEEIPMWVDTGEGMEVNDTPINEVVLQFMTDNEILIYNGDGNAEEETFAYNINNPFITWDVLENEFYGLDLFNEDNPYDNEDPSTELSDSIYTVLEQSNVLTLVEGEDENQNSYSYAWINKLATENYVTNAVSYLTSLIGDANTIAEYIINGGGNIPEPSEEVMSTSWTVNGDAASTGDVIHNGDNIEIEVTNWVDNQYVGHLEYYDNNNDETGQLYIYTGKDLNTDELGFTDDGLGERQSFVIISDYSGTVFDEIPELQWNSDDDPDDPNMPYIEYDGDKYLGDFCTIEHPFDMNFVFSTGEYDDNEDSWTENNTLTIDVQDTQYWTSGFDPTIEIMEIAGQVEEPEEENISE